MDYILLSRKLIVAKMIDVEITENEIRFRVEGEGHDLQDGGIRGDLESAIEREIEAVMGWRDLRVKVEIKA